MNYPPKRRHLNKEQKQQKRRYKQVSKYGITVQQYNQLLVLQGNKCAICRTEFSGEGGSKHSPHIDHCHTTGEVRALLCKNCNAGIGLLQDDVAILANAIKYLTAFAN